MNRTNHNDISKTPKMEITTSDNIHKKNVLLPVLNIIKSVRIRSKSTCESQSDVVNSTSQKTDSRPASKGILKRLLLKRHQAKVKSNVKHSSFDINDETENIAAPPSIGLLESILSPDSEYYVTVSGGDRSKLLTFHPKMNKGDNINAQNLSVPRLSAMFNNYYGDQNEVEDANRASSEVLCARIRSSSIVMPKAIQFDAPPNEQLEAVSKSKYFVSALNSERDISNLSHVPTAGRGLPGLTRFIYKAPPRGAAVDIGVNEEILKVFADHEIYSQFMKSNTCYQILAKSSTLIVFDSNLEIGKAFEALLYNSIRAAVIWDASKKVFDGMLTVTDLICRLRKFSQLDNDVCIQNFKKDTIVSWKHSADSSLSPLVFIGLNDSLYEATKRLSECDIHRILVKDPVSGDAVSIITHKKLLRFLYLYIYELTRPSYLAMDIEQLGIGTFDQVYSVNLIDSISTVLNIFIEQDVSAVPVVDKETGVLIDVYCKCDIIYLVLSQNGKFSKFTVSDGLKQRQKFEGFHTYIMTDTLLTVIERLVDTEVHRLIGVDCDGKVIGIISLSDILYFLVLHASRKMKSPTSSN